LVLQLEGDVFVANRADECAISGTVFLEEKVVAHDAVAADRNPEIGSGRGSQEPPV
jgi:hypothetical protein